MARPGVVNCEECWEIKKSLGIEPNCEECNNPELLEENENILNLWRLVTDQRDFNGALRVEAVLNIVEAYNGTLEDFEMIMTFDRIYREEAKKYQKTD